MSSMWVLKEKRKTFKINQNFQKNQQKLHKTRKTDKDPSSYQKQTHKCRKKNISKGSIRTILGYLVFYKPLWRNRRQVRVQEMSKLTKSVPLRFQLDRNWRSSRWTTNT